VNEAETRLERVTTKRGCRRKDKELVLASGRGFSSGQPEPGRITGFAREEQTLLTVIHRRARVERRKHCSRED